MPKGQIVFYGLVQVLKNCFAVVLGPPVLGMFRFTKKKMFGLFWYGPRLIFIRRRQPKFVANVNLSLAAGIHILLCLRMYSTGANRRDVGNLYANSGPWKSERSQNKGPRKKFPQIMPDQKKSGQKKKTPRNRNPKISNSKS